ITVNLRYAGQYADAETGLYYNGFRYYDPLTGRYLQPDPLGLSGGLNSYVYALNNPLSYIDPEGQFPLIALLKPMAYFVGGWAAGEAMDYLISYLPDNECNPLLSPRNWAQMMSDIVPAGTAYRGIRSGYKVWKGRRVNPNLGSVPALKPTITVNMNKQRKHIPGTNENKTANMNSEHKRSIINPNIDVQGVVNKYAGTGSQSGSVKRGNPGYKEKILSDEIIGKYYYTETKSFEETTNFIIHYSKNDVHIVPARPNK
uniref:RHS repeat-associated core domain-containing protein n=2 Tax=Rosenbergiella epipactidis TaxID=1544694 RepID=UPI00240E43CC